jgi:hypothetical protein
MKFLAICFLTFISQSLLAQDSWSKDLSPFKKLTLQGRIQVYLCAGATYKVEANINKDEVDLNKLDFSTKGDVLKVKYQGGAFKDVDLVLTFFLPQAVDLEANQGVEIRTKDNFILNKENLVLAAFAGGKIAANVQCSKIDASIHQGGSIRIYGTTNELYANVFTGGTIATNYLKAVKVYAKVTMGGEIITTASDLLDASVGSGGIISYKGEPKKLEQKITLGGKIEKL